MSLSSQTTLISPSAKHTNPPLHRRPSQHARRKSLHAAHPHAHAHAHTHAHGHAHGRRGSEGEAGRRALAAGLAMHTLDQSKKKKQGERPLPRGNRSDTHLPRLTRTDSTMSIASHSSATSNVSRPSAKSRRTTESIQMIDDQGKEVDPNEDEWESGEDVKQTKKGKGKQQEPSSAAMRRTVSDTTSDPKGKRTQSIAEAMARGDLVDIQDPDHRPLLTQRTTGFAGTVQPPDPQVAAEMPHVDHPIITNPIKRVASSKSLVGPISAITSIDTTPDVGLPTEPPRGLQSATSEPKRPSSGPSLRSISGSGLPRDPTDQRDEAQARDKLTDSPSYPFPKMASPTESEQKASPKDDHPEKKIPTASRSQATSSKAARSLRHRPSNSSLRSIQSLRAPPHPLNSPISYTGRNAAHESPSRGSYDKRDRVPSMHQPPVPQPQVSYEVAQGQGWDQIPEEDVQRENAPVSNQSNVDAGTTHSQNLRRSSVASTRSLRSIFAGTLAPPSAASSTPQPHKRLTALEAASAASKRPTTDNPVLYHHSLSHASGSAESCFLISRFLPPKKIRRPKWEVDIHDQERIENGGVGLTNGDYRSAHETLVSTFRELGTGAMHQKRGLPRTASGYSLLPTGLTLSSVAAATGVSNGHQDNQGLGTIKARDGARLEVARGGSGGMTPFEMSVERVLKQRPGRVTL
ncbi:expressed protein [Cryptococcus deneoformans JEC21]|uniref:Expressed protein n=1 Tax=Cryptococcus deneoformans (strain JEC21 / ATCC MYA-565) TaxID=214684 RepID=Q5KPL6_CRYD1|nr:expressed protein [Cryptococcus neoformans var. neoformans JEC21]AAW40809.1 expressed protein [Cryptococcus neoformans var. neoformans JEC21]